MNKKQQIWSIVLGIVALLVLLLIPKLGEDVDNEKIVVNQIPFSGRMEVWTTPGFKRQKFGKLTDYYKTNQIEFTDFERDEETGQFYASGKHPAYAIQYSDKGKGLILGSVRIELPLDADKMILIQTHYGSERRLIEELIKPTIGKVILATGPLMTSLESVSEKRNDLVYYITDQLNNGVYATKVENREVYNSITGEKQIIAMGAIIKDENSPLGMKRQEESPFLKYGLKVSQLSLKDLLYEQATENQIAKQREAEMEIITAKAESAKAEQNAIKAEKEGEAEAMKAKWSQEKIKAVEVTKAQQQYEVARLAALEAEENAKRIVAEGRAEAEANRLKVAAGLTPLEKAKIDMETKIGVAKALADYRGDWTPKVVGGGSGKGEAMDALGINMILQIIEKLDNKK